MSSTTHGNCSACGELCPYSAVICSMCSSRLPWAVSKAATRNMVAPTSHLPAVRTQSVPVPIAPTAMAQATTGQAYCNSCGTANTASASFCSGCGQALVALAPTNSAPAAMWAGAQQASPQQSNFNTPYANNGGANVNVTVVNKTNNSGWWAAALLLIFGTPLGCIAIPLALILFLVAFQFTPMIIAIVAIPFIWRSSLDQEIKPFVIGGIFMAGAVLNAIMLASLRP